MCPRLVQSVSHILQVSTVTWLMPSLSGWNDLILGRWLKWLKRSTFVFPVDRRAENVSLLFSRSHFLLGGYYPCNLHRGMQRWRQTWSRTPEFSYTWNWHYPWVQRFHELISSFFLLPLKFRFLSLSAF
jgi:hypothetical protein